jgi:hypothetical protein
MAMARHYAAHQVTGHTYTWSGISQSADGPSRRVINSIEPSRIRQMDRVTALVCLMSSSASAKLTKVSRKGSQDPDSSLSAVLFSQ